MATTETREEHLLVTLAIIGASINEAQTTSRNEVYWRSVAEKIVNDRFIPARTVYSFLNACPRSFQNADSTIDLRLELLNNMRAFVLTGLTPEKLKDREGRFAVLMQAGAYHSPAEYFKQKNLVLLAYKEGLKVKPPFSLEERMRNIEAVLRRNTINPMDLVTAGYKKKSGDQRVSIYVHPATGDSVTVYAPPSQQSEADKAHTKALAEKRRNQNRAERHAAQPGSGNRPPSKESTADKKGKKK